MTELSFQYEADPNVISIVIPVYQDLAGLKDTVGSIQVAHVPDGMTCEIIVVNDGADESISEYCAQLKLLEISILPNRGSYHARNRGLEQSRGAYLGFVDADIFVADNWLLEGFSALRENEYVAGYISVIREGVSAVVADYQQLVDFNTRWHMQAMKYGPTANIWVRRSLFEQIGGFNSVLFSGGDMEFGRRAHMASNCRVAYVESVAVKHPPRNLMGLLAKGKRLANGHDVIGDGVKLKSEFTFWNSVKRSFSRDAGAAPMPPRLVVFRVLLFAHRTFYKLIYRWNRSETAFQQVVSSQSGHPTIEVRDHRV